MIVTMKKGASTRDTGGVIEALEYEGLRPRILSSDPQIIVGVLEHYPKEMFDKLKGAFRDQSAVESVESFEGGKRLTSRTHHPKSTRIRIGSRYIGGGGEPLVMAGPCAVESEEIITGIARGVAECGAGMLRGGAFKPRTSPYSFRGLGVQGLKLLRQASRDTGLPVVTEVVRGADVEVVAEYADVLQVGTRNMQNYTLLEACGAQDKPVLLKRGLVATLDELLLAAEYIMAGGNSQVMLCERGIRSFSNHTRFTLDINAIPALKQMTHLPIVVDPSHSTGRRDYVEAVSLAAIAAGADGLLVEVHSNPDEALVDGAQSLDLEMFGGLMKKVEGVAKAVGG